VFAREVAAVQSKDISADPTERSGFLAQMTLANTDEIFGRAKQELISKAEYTGFGINHMKSSMTVGSGACPQI
jgi:hypothetical protein